MKLKKALSILILLSQLVLVTSCGSNTAAENDVSTNSGDSPQVSANEETTERMNANDSLPELNFSGETVSIAYRGDEVSIRYEIFGGEEETGDVLSDKVIARNRAVEERLNIKFDFQAGSDSHGTFMDSIGRVILAGDNLYDIVDAVQWLVMSQVTEGYYHNLAGAPYIDYSKPWWSNEYMNDVFTSKDTRFLLSGDISQWQLRNTGCMFFNKALYENYFGETETLYNQVIDGKWTYDVLTQYVRQTWNDLNGDGAASAGDIVGIVMMPDAYTDHFTYSAGMHFTERDSSGYPVLVTKQERNVRVVETLYNLFFETPGSLFYPSGAQNDIDIVNNFINGNVLFYPYELKQADKFRDMEDPYGIIPYPKLDESQESYKSLIHDATTLFGVPITVQNIDKSCAVMEAMCAENYRSVTPTYYDIVLKAKYMQDELSSQMLDIIHDNTCTDFAYVNNYCFSSSVKLGTITRSLMGYGGMTKSKDYMSLYDSIKESVKNDIAKIINAADK